MNHDPHQVSSLEALRHILGEPWDGARHKQHESLDAHDIAWIAASPFLMLSTSSRDGWADASPRGDAPGFVRVLDAKTLVIPDRPGNQRADSLRNILETGRVGLIFLIPGRNETLRINGCAAITTEPALLETMTVNGKTPKLAVRVHVEEAFLHCGKAFICSKLWQPDAWTTASGVPSAGVMYRDQIPEVRWLEVKQVEALLEDDYRDGLY
jgi:hypothetical protein